jgi:hypothetical protein
VHLIESVYDDQVRNAFSHSDYIITEDTFRWTEGGLGGQLPLENLNNFISNAFSFTGMFMAIRDRWLALAAEMPRYHRWPNYEVFELLKSEGKLDGFRVHFSNGTSARFHRSPGGVDLMNVTIQPDGTINFMVGLLDALTSRYVVDGKEVEFNGKNSTDTFENPPTKYRVVRHTYNADGKLSERRVISGSHVGRADAEAALEGESRRYSKCERQTESGRWKVTDNSGAQLARDRGRDRVASFAYETEIAIESRLTDSHFRLARATKQVPRMLRPTVHSVALGQGPLDRVNGFPKLDQR